MGSVDARAQPKTDGEHVTLNDLPISRPVDIVFVTTDLAYGGAEKNLLELARSLPDDEYNPHVIGLKSPRGLEVELDRENISWESLEMDPGEGSPLHPESFFKLTDRISSLNPTILQTYLFHANLMGRIAGRLSSVPIVLSSIRVCEEGSWFHPILEGLTHGLVDRAICVSSRVRDFTDRRAGIPESKLPVIPNGVSLEHLQEPAPDRAELLQTIGLDVADPLILSAGRLHRQKGYDLLIPALETLREEHTSLQAIIFGEGEEREHLLHLREEHDLSDHLHFPGWTDRLTEWMKIADLFVLPSRWEGMPNVLLEAGALELPIVASRAGGVRDIFPSDMDTGRFLVETGSPEQLTSALQEVLEDPRKSRNIAEQYGKYIRETFTVDQMVTKHRRLYGQLLQDLF